MLEHDGAPRPFGRYHNAYGMEMCRATLEAFSRYRPDERPFILTRSAYAGIQRFAAVWTGDNHSWWEHVAMAMPMHLNVGLSGVAFVGGDIGGFSDNATGELFARWMQLGVFTPFCRAHSAIGTRPQEPWAFGEEVESICRRYVELRYRLLPFWYSEMFRAHTTGQPLMRPLVYAYPDDHRTYNLSDQFLVGDVFLVAPVYRPSSVVRAVYLPAGRWYEYWTDRLVEGGRDVLADAPIETLPLYVRAGSIVPTTEVSQFVGERPDTPLIVDVYPGANGEMLLYEDDGSTFGYRRGEYRSTRFTLRSDSSTAVLNVAVEAAVYDVGRDRWILRVHAAGPEGSVSGPTVQSVSYNARARIRECVIGEGDSTLSITV
jgi:alpha-glucosidase